MPIFQTLRLLLLAAFVLLTGCNLLDARLKAFDCLDPDACDTGDDTATDTYVDTNDTDTDTDSGDDTVDSDSDTNDTYVDTDTSVTPTDADNDGYDDSVDCDDTNANVHPDAVETCNGIDDDCDTNTDESGAAGEASWYADDDGDEYGSASDSVLACDQPAGYVSNATDCDDTNGDMHPYADESCTETVDMNCDGSAGTADSDGDGVAACEDCDDTDASAFPGGVEVCDEVDNDCDGGADNDASDASTWYADSDSDGFGDASVSTSSCSAPSGYVADDTDCDDTEASAFPGGSEVCDEDDVDENCDGTAEGSDSSGTTDWHNDVDGDGYGSRDDVVTACNAPAGYITGNGDCDDDDAAVHAGATETCNEIDDNCDGNVDESGASGESTWYADADGDGYGNVADSKVSCEADPGYVADATDCDDGESGTNPGAVEQCNSVDDDCDGSVDDGVVYSTWYADSDSDGFGDASTSVNDCTQPSGYVADATDCDDTNGDIQPFGDESCNGADDDCDGDVDESGATDEGSWYADSDSDGFGDASVSTSSCSAPSGYVASATDCDDADAAVNPAASESCDSMDNDCDGSVDEGVSGSTWYADSDSDGFGDASVSTSSCSAPSGYVADSTDCDDTEASAFPGGTEVTCDGIDQDCDGTADVDTRYSVTFAPDFSSYSDFTFSGELLDAAGNDIWTYQTWSTGSPAGVTVTDAATYSTVTFTECVDATDVWYISIEFSDRFGAVRTDCDLGTWTVTADGVSVSGGCTSDLSAYTW